MHYKTIVLELLQEQYPKLHEQLRQERTLLMTLDEYANELKSAHLAWMDEIRRASPESDESQVSSEALQLAIEHLQGGLPCESPMGETAEALSLDAAMAFITPHTPPG